MDDNENSQHHLYRHRLIGGDIVVPDLMLLVHGRNRFDMKPEKFNGNGSFETFLMGLQFENCAAYNRWSTDDKVAHHIFARRIYAAPNFLKMGIKMPRFVVFWTTSTIKDENTAANFHYIKTVSGNVVAHSIVFRVVSIHWQGTTPSP